MRCSRRAAIIWRFLSIDSSFFRSFYSRFSRLTCSFSSLFSRRILYFSVSDLSGVLLSRRLNCTVVVRFIGFPGLHRACLRLYFVPNPARLLRTTPVVIRVTNVIKNEAPKQLPAIWTPRLSNSQVFVKLLRRKKYLQIGILI